MRSVILTLSLLVTFVFMAFGSGFAAKPDPETRFKEQCPLAGGEGNDGCSDILAICNAYGAVIGIKQASREACVKSCKDIAHSQHKQYEDVSPCPAGIEQASALCTEYCRATYSQ